MSEPEALIRLKSDMKEAMKARQAERLAAIRLLIASLQQKQIDQQKDLTDEQALDVLSTEAKKRREAAAAYRDGGRTELAEKEEGELKVIEDYLPKQLTPEEVEALVDEILEETGVTKKSDMGRVMGQLMPKVKGRFDGSQVKGIVMGKLE